MVMVVNTKDLSKLLSTHIKQPNALRVVFTQNSYSQWSINRGETLWVNNIWVDESQ